MNTYMVRTSQGTWAIDAGSPRVAINKILKSVSPISNKKLRERSRDYAWFGVDVRLATRDESLRHAAKNGTVQP